MTKITQKPDGSVSFDLVITKATIAKEYGHVLAEVAKTTSIKGFRPGKAPIKMVESQTDKSRLLSHVLDHVLSPAYSEVIHEHKLVPLIDPHVNPKSMEEGKDWVMAVEVAITPTIDLGDYAKYIPAALKKHAINHKEPKDAKPEEEKDHKLNVIFDALLDKSAIAVAPILVDAETRSALERLAKQLSSLKLSIEDYAKSIKKSTDDLVSEYKKSALSNLKLEFILQKLILDKKPDVTDAEIAELKPQKGQESYAKYVVQKRKVLDILAAL
ncbi:MAG: trigger factor [Microgenomates group bacterium]